MNARIYASLFPRQEKILFLVFAGFFALMAFGISIGNREMDVSMLGISFLFPPLGLGAFLAESWNQPLRRPTTALLPGLQPTLFRWHIRVVMTAAISWAAIVHFLEPRIPLVAAIGISAGMFTLSLVLSIGKHTLRIRPGFLLGLLGGVACGLTLGGVPSSRLVRDSCHTPPSLARLASP